MKTQSSQGEVIVAMAILGVIATATFAADQFDFFFLSEKRASEAAPLFFEGGTLVGDAAAQSTERILTQEQ